MMAFLTPRATRSKLYHIYEHVRDDLNQKGRAARASSRSGFECLLSAGQGLAGDCREMEGGRISHPAGDDQRGQPN